MLKFLRSIFGGSDTGGGVPESLVKAAIERAVDGTDPWIRAVTGYQRRLRPAIVLAIRYVVALVDCLLPPVSLVPESYRDNPLLRTFFISSSEVRELLEKDRNLANFLRGQTETLPSITALLVLEKRQRMIMGAELSGTVVERDVPQITVSFEAGRLIDPAAYEIQARHLLKRRAFDHLLSLALKAGSATSWHGAARCWKPSSVCCNAADGDSTRPMGRSRWIWSAWKRNWPALSSSCWDSAVMTILRSIWNLSSTC